MNRISMRPHAVVREALPHLGEEQRHQSAGMTEDLRAVRGIALDALIHIGRLALVQLLGCVMGALGPRGRRRLRVVG